MVVLPKVGFVGCGKMGLPVAVSMSLRGLDVMGYDLDLQRASKSPKPELEAGPGGEPQGFNKCLEESSIRFGTLMEVVSHADLLFLAVQTPHDPQYEGTTLIPETRKDFDYSFLRRAVHDIVWRCRHRTKPLALVVMSTVLPGTMRRKIMPLLTEQVRLVYNPSFIAMGTAMRDFLYPEFVLIGVEDQWAADKLGVLYGSLFAGPDCLTHPPLHFMSIESAELTKVAYNCYIGWKIAFANTIMEICHRIPEADCDSVIDALSDANRRLISSLYLRGGMGDGGHCHPRDLIAMGHLALQLKLSHDVYGDVMACREDQARWKADLVALEAGCTGLPVVLLGFSFKANTNLTAGSPALLVSHILAEEYNQVVTLVDPFHDDRWRACLDSPAVFLIACKHDVFQDVQFPAGSVVIDPHRYLVEQEAVVKVIKLGAAE